MNFSSALFWWLCIGGVTGWFASLLFPPRGKQHLYVDVFFGVMGALAASLTVEKLVRVPPNHYALLLTMGAALAGACVAVLPLRLLSLRARPATR
ncbi:MAG: GlsB/YeaQ/YmgE family stress response membrane protein [Archangium sp.]